MTKKKLLKLLNAPIYLNILDQSTSSDSEISWWREGAGNHLINVPGENMSF